MLRIIAGGSTPTAVVSVADIRRTAVRESRSALKSFLNAYLKTLLSKPAEHAAPHRQR